MEMQSENLHKYMQFSSQLMAGKLLDKECLCSKTHYLSKVELSRLLGSFLRTTTSTFSIAVAGMPTSVTLSVWPGQKFYLGSMRSIIRPSLLQETHKLRNHSKDQAIAQSSRESTRTGRLSITHGPTMPLVQKE